MTAQAGESLLYKGEETWMAAEPLEQYLNIRDDINFVADSTACWRGYYGKWEIKNDKLYLIDLTGHIEDFKEVGMDYLFPGQDKVFANWFTGEIRLPRGEMLKYIHMGYASIFEKDLILYFKEGILTGEKEIDNRDAFKK